jgi:hypothetical protein
MALMLPYKASYHKQWKPLAGKIEIRKYSRQKARRIQCSYYRLLLSFSAQIAHIFMHQQQTYSAGLYKQTRFYFQV